MKHDMAMTKNVRRFLAAVRELQYRSLGVEGMGLLWGLPGEGKSTTVAYATNALDGVYLRANACWTVTSMLQELSRELGMETRGRKAQVLQAAADKLLESPRPIFVDEADYLLRSTDMLDTLRDVYDMTGAPVFLIGMEDMARNLQRRARGRFARRITQWVEFRGLDLADTKIVVETVCEFALTEDLIQHLHQASAANIGRMITGLAKIENFAKNNKLEEVSLSDWGDRQLFYDQPRFARK